MLTFVTFSDKYKNVSEIQNWFYSEDKTNIYRIFQRDQKSVLLSKGPPPREAIDLNDITFDLEEEEEDEEDP